MALLGGDPGGPRAKVPRARRVTTVPPPRPRVVSTSPACRSAAIASRSVARLTASRVGQVALRRQGAPGRVDPQPDRGGELLHARLEGVVTAHRAQHRPGQVLERAGRSRGQSHRAGAEVSMVGVHTNFGTALDDGIPAGLASDRSHPVAPREGFMADLDKMTDDEKHLAKLGYSQELNRSWSGFSNFAISFSIISILAGCFTNFGAGFNNGGPISISWSWPILGVFILIIGFTMSELVSAYPTSGGIYWWASKLGGPAAGFFTGWLNLIGLVAVTAGVSYGCATFIDLTISTYSESLRRRLLADPRLHHLRDRARAGRRC